MEQYEVIPLSLSGKGKRLFKNGDIVTENDFAPNSIPNLIATGFLRLKQEKKEEIKQPEKVEQKAVVVEIEKPKQQTKSRTTKRGTTKSKK